MKEKQPNYLTMFLKQLIKVEILKFGRSCVKCHFSLLLRKIGGVGTSYTISYMNIEQKQFFFFFFALVFE